MAANWWDAAPLIGASTPAAAPTGSVPDAGAQWWANAPLVGAAPASSALAASQPPVLEAAVAGLGQGLHNIIDKPAELLAGVFSKSEADKVREANASNKVANEQAYGNSTAYKTGQVGGEVLATLPVGGALGAVVKGFGAGAALPRVAALGDAIVSGGLSAQGAGLGVRAAGGAISGAATAGLVDPQQAAAGAVIGAALPAGVRAGGQLFNRVGQAVRGPEIPAGIVRAAEEGQRAGYVTPPSTVNPTLLNQTIEGIGGKIKTAQLASQRNQSITNELARGAIGASDLSTEAIAAVRARANEAYSVLGQSAPFQADDAFRAALQKASSMTKEVAKDFPELRNSEVEQLVEGLSSRPQFGAQPTIEAIKQLRFSGAGNKAAMDPAKKALGSAQMKVASALEDLIDRNLERSGNQELLAGYREARTTLAKAYDVEKALNPATGNVDAAKIARLKAKGRPLTGELKQIADFASAFPRSVQTPERVGGVTHFSPLDWAAGGFGAGMGSPATAAAMALTRPLSRAAALSAPVQRGLTRSPASAEPGLGVRRLGPLETAQRLSSAAPVALTSRDR